MPKVPPPVFAVAGLLAQHLLAGRRRPTAVRAVAASTLAVGSACVAASAVQAFRREHTTVNPVEPERASALVVEGPFGYTRNPMYVGLAGLLAAHAVLRGGLLPFVPVVGLVAVIDRLQIPAEERAMSARFGADYEGYRGSVPRWVGRVRA